jgi:hypothetical protein
MLLRPHTWRDEPSARAVRLVREAQSYDLRFSIVSLGNLLKNLADQLAGAVTATTQIQQVLQRQAHRAPFTMSFERPDGRL